MAWYAGSALHVPGASESRVDSAGLQTLAHRVGLFTAPGPLRCRASHFAVHGRCRSVSYYDIPGRLGRGRGAPSFGHVCVLSYRATRDPARKIPLPSSAPGNDIILNRGRFGLRPCNPLVGFGRSFITCRRSQRSRNLQKTMGTRRFTQKH